MNCFESRRRLLAAPRELSALQRSHLESCPACGHLAADLATLDRKISKTTRVAVPDGISERILIARDPLPRWHYAAGIAAAFLFVSIGSVTLFPELLEPSEPTLAAEAVGAAHPAIAAISMVIDREPALLREPQTLDPAAVQERLKFVGLALKSRDVSARYVGKCEVAGRECDHLVLTTAEGHVSVFLMAHEPRGGRVLVADRRMTALLSPAPTGAYIVVAESPRAVRRAQKLFVHG